jgi:hypothetical protein
MNTRKKLARTYPFNGDKKATSRLMAESNASVGARMFYSIKPTGMLVRPLIALGTAMRPVRSWKP